MYLRANSQSSAISVCMFVSNNGNPRRLIRYHHLILENVEVACPLDSSYPCSGFLMRPVVCCVTFILQEAVVPVHNVRYSISLAAGMLVQTVPQSGRLIVSSINRRVTRWRQTRQLVHNYSLQLIFQVVLV